MEGGEIELERKRRGSEEVTHVGDSSDKFPYEGKHGRAVKRSDSRQGYREIDRGGERVTERDEERERMS